MASLKPMPVIVLPADLSAKPYHTTLKFKAYDAVGQGTADFAVDLVVRDFANGTLPAQCDQCYFYFSADSFFGASTTLARSRSSLARRASARAPMLNTGMPTFTPIDQPGKSLLKTCRKASV